MRSTINLAFRRATRGLAHPVSMGAVVVLLLNDHWLRWAHPSWVTGKLGDAAWLIFSPLIAALVVAWIVPRGLTGKWHERVVGWVSFGGIGAWFALAKTVPFVHGWTLDALEGVTGWRGMLLMDASDLLTLPALCIGWWVWQRVEHETADFRLVGWAAVGLGVMGSVATSPSIPNYGLSCVRVIDNQLYAFDATYYDFHSGGYYSQDGGLTWSPNPNEIPRNKLPICPRTPVDDVDVVFPEQTDKIYRFQRYHISSSIDNGKSWFTEIDLTFLEADVRLYFHDRRKDKPLSSQAVSGVFDAIIDPQTGNLIVAMGQDGILVREVDGLWEWVSVGPYHLVDIYQFEELPALLAYETSYAVLLIALMWLTVIQVIVKPAYTKALIIIAWIIWSINILYAPFKWPQESLSNLISFFIASVYLPSILVILVLILLVQYGYFWYKARGHAFPNKNEVVYSILWAGMSGAYFICLYLLWTQAYIPSYRFTGFSGVVVSLFFMVMGRWLLLKSRRIR